MDLLSAQTLLETYFSTHWTATPVVYENVEARNWTATGQPLLPEGEVDYVTFRTEYGRSETITIPGNCRRQYGVLFPAVCVRDATGVRVAMSHARDLVALLESKEIASGSEILRLWTLGGTQKYRPADGWFVVELAFNFSFERHVPSV